MKNIGDIYIINFPFTDSTGFKQRPCLIIKDEIDDFEVLFITKKPQNNSLIIKSSDFSVGGLFFDSFVRLNKGFLFSKNLFLKGKYVGTLKENKLKEVLKTVLLGYVKTYFYDKLDCVSKCLNYEN